MNETSLLNEYQKINPGVIKVFVIPEIPLVNKNTSYLFQLYKEFLKPDSIIKIETFNASSLPKIFISRLKFEKSILHYHWFEFEDFKSLIGIKWKLFWIILFKIFGGKVVWTVHNYYPHHQKYIWLNKKCRRMMAFFADKLHIHCKNETDAVSNILNVKKEKFFVIEHPDFIPEFIERRSAIENLNKKYFNNQLKDDNKIFLMFGAIAEYKCIEEVIEIFKRKDTNNKLIISGFVKKGNRDYYNKLKNLAEGKRIFVEGNLINDEDVPYFLNSADYLIFNYKDILTSGGVVLAMNYKKNIIAPELGCLKYINYSKLIKFNRKDVTLEQVLLSL